MKGNWGAWSGRDGGAVIGCPRDSMGNIEPSEDGEQPGEACDAEPRHDGVVPRLADFMPPAPMFF